MYKIFKASSLKELEKLVDEYAPESNEKYEVVGVSIGGVTTIRESDVPYDKTLFIQSVYILTRNKIQTTTPNK